MSDETQPSVTRAAISRTTQACQRCRALKTRCLPSDSAGTCQRCFGAGRECNWAEAPRRAKKSRAPSRISQVEQKLDGLVASLINPSSEPQLSSVSESAPANQQHQPTSVSTPAAQPCQSASDGEATDGRPLAPGTWLPFPSSFEEQPEGLDTPAPQLDEGEDVADRQYIEQIRRIHNFGDSEDNSKYPGGLFRPSKRREEPIKDDLIDSLLASGKADVLLRDYKEMSDSFPFVPLSSEMTAYQLHADSPMLFLAIITAASWKEHKRQMSLDAIFRQELANRTIIRPRRNLGLVQSVLVYLSWYHFVFSHKTQQIFFLHHLVIGLALDIGLHRDFQPMFFANTRRPPNVEPKVKRERQRAFLGCYYLASMISAALQKPNLLKYSSDMTRWAQELRDHGEFATDEVLEHLISLRQLDDEVQDTLFTGAGADARLTDARVVMHVRFLETRLEAWKRDSGGAKCKRMLLLSHAYTDMMLHTIALRPIVEPTNLPASDSSHVKSLLSALEAAKRFFDTLLSFAASDYHLISFAEWSRLPTVMMTVAKLCIPTDSHTTVGWDVKTAQNVVRLDICLEALCYRFQNQTTYDKVTQPHPDFWWAMRFVTDLTRSWYVRKISTEAQEGGSSLPTPTLTTPHHVVRSDTGALPTPPERRNQGNGSGFPDIDFSSMDMDIGMDGGDDDPVAFLKSAEFDMEQFFDMGIWGDEAYHGMGFGGGGMPF